MDHLLPGGRERRGRRSRIHLLLGERRSDQPLTEGRRTEGGESGERQQRCPPRDPRRPAPKPSGVGEGPPGLQNYATFLKPRSYQQTGRGWLLGVNCTGDANETAGVSGQLETLQRRQRPPSPTPSQRQDVSTREARGPGALAWRAVSGRAPAGTTWARSEAESGRAVAAVPPELAGGPGSLGCVPNLQGWRC